MSNFAFQYCLKMFFRKSRLFVLGNFIFTLSCIAHSAPRCELAFAMQTPLVAQLEELFQRKHNGIGTSGYLGNTVPHSPLAAFFARSHGIEYWGQRIYIQPTLEAAAAHAAVEKDPLLKGLYLIGSAMSDPQHGHARLGSSKAIELDFKLLIDNGLYDFGTGKAVKVPSKSARALINPRDLFWAIDQTEPDRGPYLHVSGWFYPKQRGVILHRDTVHSTTYKRIRREARRAQRLGYRVAFNRDFNQSLEQAAKMHFLRGGASRYAINEVRDLVRYAGEAGRAFSVEMWNKNNELIGGIIVIREMNVYIVDTFFHVPDRQNSLGLNAPKITLLALLERLKEAGIPFVDTWAVSPLTAALKGSYITQNEFSLLLEQLPNRPVDFDRSDWTPLDDEREQADNSAE